MDSQRNSFPDLDTLQSRLDAHGVGYCATELAFAVARLDEAETIEHPAIRAALLKSARRAIDGVLKVMPRLQLPAGDLQLLWWWVDVVDDRLLRATEGEASNVWMTDTPATV